MLWCQDLIFSPTKLGGQTDAEKNEADEPNVCSFKNFRDTWNQIRKLKVILALCRVQCPAPVGVLSQASVYGESLSVCGPVTEWYPVQGACMDGCMGSLCHLGVDVYISPVMPKMSRMLGTKMTNRFTANSRQTAMPMCRTQWKGFPGNSSWRRARRIWQRKKDVHKEPSYL